MKKYVFLILLFCSNFVIASIYYHPYVNNKFNILNKAYPFQVVLLQDFPYRPWPEDVIKNFKRKVVKYSFEYQKNARDYGIIRPLPFEIFVFKMDFRDLNSKESFNGYCNINNNIIYLNPFFTEKTFYHELGHCDLGYSHKEDELVAKVGKSKYLMNWFFDPDHYNLSLHKVLSNFFLHSNHNQLLSEKGNTSHNAMIKYNKEFKEKFK